MVIKVMTKATILEAQGFPRVLLIKKKIVLQISPEDLKKWTKWSFWVSGKISHFHNDSFTDMGSSNTGHLWDLTFLGRMMITV